MSRKKLDAPASPPIASFKGFDKDFKCRDFQYAVGSTYTINGRVEVCSVGFHACEAPPDVWNYYPPGTSKFAEVIQGGELSRDSTDSKIASAEITIRAELTLPAFVKRVVDWVSARSTATVATGYRGHGVATGYRGHGVATGDSGHGVATGDSGHGVATGYRGHGVATGDSGHGVATGYRGHGVATGDSGHASASGFSGIAASLGMDGTAQAGADGWIVLAAWKWDGDRYVILNVKSAKVGGPEGVKAGVKYSLAADGTFKEAA